MTIPFLSSTGRRLLGSLWLLLLPLLGWGQTTIVNYNFNAGSTFAAAVASPTTASGVTSTATATGTTPATVAGTTPDNAFTPGAAAGNAITINPFSTGNYFQFQLGGASLNTYGSYKLFFQAQRSNTGPGTVTVAYSLNGSSFTNFGTTGTAGNGSFVENVYDLSGISALNNQTAVYFRILPSGSSAGTFRIDNFQVQAYVGTPPTVTTGTATTTGTTTATVDGNATALGSGASVIDRGAYYIASANVTAAGVVAVTGGTQTSTGTTGLGTFTTSLTGLTSNTLYYTAAYATSSVGINRGTQTSFTTQAAVTTTAVTTFTTTTATAPGNVTVGGGEAVTDRGVYYSTTPGIVATGGGTKQAASPATGTGAFNASLTGLTPGTLYYVAAYVTNAGGTSYGSQVSFTTTAATPPTVTTTAATLPTSTTGATLNASIGSLGSPTASSDYGFLYSTTVNTNATLVLPDNGTTIIKAQKGTTGATTGTYSLAVTGLAANTLYYDQAYVTNSAGTSYGGVFNFTTLATVSSTTDATPGATTAAPGGTVAAGGGASITDRGVYYSTTPGVVATGGGTKQAATTPTGTGAFTASLTGLSPGTTYYVAAYATNAGGTSYGAQVSFITPAVIPTVTTSAVTPFSYTTATAPGSVGTTSGAAITDRGVYYSTTPGIVATGGGTKQAATSPTGTGSFNASLTGLSPGTMYYVAAYATNTVGTGYGAEVSFTTTAAASPTLATLPAASVTAVAATLNGTISSFGGPTGASPAYGFVYSKTADDPNPQLGGASVTTVTVGTAAFTGNFSTSISGLVSSTGYSFQAYATNGNGTAYGGVKTFTTLSPTITTGALTGTPVCATADANITVAYTTVGTFTGTYTVELSDASGSFLTTPTTLVTTGSNSPLTATIPAGTPSGIGYKVRVLNSNPATKGSASAAFTIVSNPTVTIAPNITQTIVQGASVAFTGTESAGATSRVWVYGTSPGTYGTTTANTTLSYTFTPPATGTYYVALRSTFAACGDVTSAGTQVDVTVPPPSAPGLLVLEDDFNYPAATKLSANGWVVHSGGGFNDEPDVISGNLTKTTYPTGDLATNPNHASSTSTSADVNRGFTLLASQTTTYMSALINIPVGTGVSVAYNDYFLHLLERNAAGTSATNFRARLFAAVGSSTGKFTLRVGLSGTAAQISAATVDYDEGQTYLVVVKYVSNFGGNDVASLFVFNNAATVPLTEPNTPATSVQGTTSYTVLPNGVAIRQSTTTPIVDIDGIRIATGWGAAVGRPVFTAATATVNAGSYYDLTLNNGSTLAPAGAVSVEKTLTLTSGILNTSTTNSLTLSQGATTVGGSSTSYVNGPLARATGAGMATTIFPLGSGTVYRPLTLTATSQVAASTYTATQTEGDAGQSVAPGSGLLRVSQIRRYTVTSSNTTAGNFMGTITLSFGADDGVNTPNNSGLVVAKRDATGTYANQWTNIGHGSETGGGGNGPGGATVAGTITSNSFSNFSDFTLGATNLNTFTLSQVNPLPVTLTSFTARRAPAGVLLAWATASELHSDYFEVERSLDGDVFTAVARVAGQGSTAQAHPYAATDHEAPATALYYRLRQVDEDGSSAYSPTVAVAGAATELTLSPNPAHTTVSLLTAQPTPYTVRNTLGQPVLTGTTAAGLTTVAVADLPAGLYFFELRIGTSRVVGKFVKQ